MSITKISPEVSIVIPTYNRANLLKRALESVRSQVFQNWEAIIIDEGSTDDTYRIIENFHDERIHVIQFKAKGNLAAARNEGIRITKGQFVAFLDSDDTWYPKKLSKCLEALTPQIDLISHGLNHIKNGKFLKKNICTHTNECTNYKRMLFSGMTCLTTSAVFIRKSSLDKVSGFYEESHDENKSFKIRGIEEGGPVHLGAEDYDLWLRLSRVGTRFHFIKEVLGEYHIHSDQSSRAARCRIASNLAVLDRHFGNNNISLFERLQRRKRRAQVFYMVGRGLQEDKRNSEALSLFFQCTLIWPFGIKNVLASLLAVWDLARTKLSVKNLF